MPCCNPESRQARLNLNLGIAVIKKMSLIPTPFVDTVLLIYRTIFPQNSWYWWYGIILFSVLYQNRWNRSTIIYKFWSSMTLIISVGNSSGPVVFSGFVPFIVWSTFSLIMFAHVSLTIYSFSASVRWSLDVNPRQSKYEVNLKTIILQFFQILELTNSNRRNI